MSVETVVEPGAATLPERAARGALTLWRRLDTFELTRTTALSAVTALTLISALLRVWALNFHYWVDEAISIGIASHPLSQLPQLLRHDGSPPLYYLLLHFWIQAFGNGEVATHLLSLLFALLAVPAAYWAGSAIERRVGLLSSLLIAGVPFLTYYAQETRMYALMALLSLLVCGAFLRVFVYRRRGYLPALVLSLTACLYTHNWGLYFAVATAAAALLCIRAAPPQQRRRLVRDAMIGLVGVAVLFAPWLPSLLYQARNTGAPWALPPVLWSLTQGLYFLAGDRAEAAVLLLAGGTGLLSVYRLRHPGRQRERTIIHVLLVLSLLTFALAWVEAKVNPSWAMRYEAVMLGPLALLFALGLVNGRKGLTVVGLVLVCSWWVLDPQPTSRYSKSNVAAVAQHERWALTSQTLVLSTQPEQVPVLAYYMPRVRRFATPLQPTPLADPHVVDWVDALAKFERSSTSRVLAPLVRTVAPGQRVALVIPIGLPDEAHYLKLAVHDSRTWLAYLKGDHAFREITWTQYKSRWASSAVRIYIFRRRV